MKKANVEIREALINYGVKQWELADRRGMAEEKLCKIMRHELAADEKKLLLSMIQEIAAEKEGD